MSRFAQALASYDAALALDNAHVKAFNNRGLVLQELGRLTEALSSFDRASTLDPRFAGSQANRAAVLLMSCEANGSIKKRGRRECEQTIRRGAAAGRKAPRRVATICHNSFSDFLFRVVRCFHGPPRALSVHFSVTPLERNANRTL